VRHRISGEAILRSRGRPKLLPATAGQGAVSVRKPSPADIIYSKRYTAFFQFQCKWARCFFFFSAREYEPESLLSVLSLVAIYKEPPG